MTTLAGANIKIREMRDKLKACEESRVRWQNKYADSQLRVNVLENEIQTFIKLYYYLRDKGDDPVLDVALDELRKISVRKPNE